MASLLQVLFLLSLSCLLFFHGVTAAANHSPKSYVVYMGSPSSEETASESDESAHLELLSSVIPSEEPERLSLTHSYNHALKGFSAMLTEKEASVLSSHDNVVSVFPDPTLELHTTRSWDFLEAQAGIQSNHQYPFSVGQDVIIGVIDTGIWPESPSFNDMGIGAIPSRWKGVCMEGSDFKKSNCNRKLIGARYYGIQDDNLVDLKSGQNNMTRRKASIGSARDTVGHGTHTASTAAGAPVANASYYELAKGIAKGGSPSSRIAAYKACSAVGCSGGTLLKAIDDAVKDGVDIISISIGMSSILQSDYMNDPIAIGAFHASQKGVMVVCSGGNDGPDPSTVVNSAPWIFTVAASDIDRAFFSTVVLGNGRVFQGSAINFSNLTRGKMYPLAFGGDIASTSTPLSEASNCYPGSLDSRKVIGKIIICTNTDPMVSRKIKKLVGQAAQAKGMIFIDELEKGSPFDSGIFPFSEVGDADGFQILKYVNSTRNPTATILSTKVVQRFKPSPSVAYFSSRGPGALTEAILKPDITAPGVGILASVIPINETGTVPSGRKPSMFSIKSGTSMACPHVAGVAAFIKSVHPTWTPSMIKSALITTATSTNNMGKPMTNSTYAFASPHEAGAGEISPHRALHPGLVYETTTKDYLYFLCYYGYKEKVIRSISGNKLLCPNKSSEDLISDLNYPSISIRMSESHSVRTITRTVTNVGSRNATYIAKVNSPTGLIVKVSPTRLVFSQGSSKASFKVSFYDKGASKGYRFGSLTWSDGLHFVRTVFAVNIV